MRQSDLRLAFISKSFDILDDCLPTAAHGKCVVDTWQARSPHDSPRRGDTICETKKVFERRCEERISGCLVPKHYVQIFIEILSKRKSSQIGSIRIRCQASGRHQNGPPEGSPCSLAVRAIYRRRVVIDAGDEREVSDGTLHCTEPSPQAVSGSSMGGLDGSRRLKV